MSDIPMMPGLVDQRGRPISGEPMDTIPPPIKPKEKPCLDGKVKDAAGNCVDKPCNQFENRVKQVINTEGGFVNDPTDSGGATNKGIAWPTWKENAKSVLEVEPTLENLKNLTDAQAKQIYRHTFWDAISADQINDGDVRYLLFDFYVNSRVWAIKKIQQVLNTMGDHLTVDGDMGSNTLKAINNADPVRLYNGLKQARIDFINNYVRRSINAYLKKYLKATEKDLKKYTQKRFINGWLNRVREFKNKNKHNKYNVNCN